MAKGTSTKAKERIFFTKNKDTVELPNLVDHQNKSFQWFVEEGLGELLAELSPIDDYTGTKLSLKFKDYHFDAPKITEAEARENNISFESPLKATVELTNKVTGEVKEQEIYLGDYPWICTSSLLTLTKVRPATFKRRWTKIPPAAPMKHW
jgi:DNA-directed RNA polymerase subunit beta